jgi:hypothetical protein
MKNPLLLFCFTFSHLRKNIDEVHGTGSRPEPERITIGVVGAT